MTSGYERWLRTVELACEGAEDGAERWTTVNDAPPVR